MAMAMTMSISPPGVFLLSHLQRSSSLMRHGARLLPSSQFSASLLVLLLFVSNSFLAYVDAALPKGACYFEQHFIVNTGVNANPNNDPECQFQVIRDEFLDVIGSNPLLVDVGQALASQGVVYVKSENMIYYTTRKEPLDYSTRIERIKFELFQAGQTPNQPEVFAPGSPVATGMALHPNGSLIVAFQGVGGDRPDFGRIALYNLTDPTASHRPFADNWCGREFNSPHDLAITGDGYVYFTDPDYGYAGGFKSPPTLEEAVYRVSPGTGLVDIVANGLQKPKAIALSKDAKKLYVSESAAWEGNRTTNPTLDTTVFNQDLPHNIWAYDIDGSGRLTNKKFFTSTMNFGGYGILAPMSIKTDTSGRVYVATNQGVQVYSSSGSPIGVIKLSSVTGIGWGGKSNDYLIIVDEQLIRAFKIGTCCGVTSSAWRLAAPPSFATVLFYLWLLSLSILSLALDI